MEYEYGFEYAFPDMMDGAFMGAASVIAGIFLIVYLLALGFSVVSYVLNAVGMYRIAKRRGIHHAWLAWIPVGCNWLLGSISDHYQYVVNQKITRRRKVLLILTLIMLGISLVFGGAITAMGLSMEHAAGEMAGAILLVALIAITYLCIAGLSIAILVFCYIAYYDMFKSCKPNQAVLFLVLGILFNVTLPFFVFACSDSDKGMPERRPQQPEQIIQPEPSAEEDIPVVEAEVVEDPE